MGPDVTRHQPRDKAVVFVSSLVNQKGNGHAYEQIDWRCYRAEAKEAVEQLACKIHVVFPQWGQRAVVATWGQATVDKQLWRGYAEPNILGEFLCLLPAPSCFDLFG